MKKIWKRFKMVTKKQQRRLLIQRKPGDKKDVMKTPKEEKKQASKARADHAMKCSLVPGKKRSKRKPQTELYVEESFTEHREEWKKEFQGHCDEVYVDPRRRPRNKERGLQSSKEMVTDTLRKKEELLRSRLIWCYRRGPRK